MKNNSNIPSLNDEKNTDGVQTSPSVSPSLDSLPKKSESDFTLPAPEHKMEEVVETKTNTESEGIDVVATRKGFYNLQRLREGDVFKIKNFKEIGEWMKCLDPDLEKKRLEILKNKKAII